MKKHLAIMHKSAIEAISCGVKTIETRFSKHRIAPYGQVSVGDIVFMKLPGKEIIGQLKVKKALFFEGMEQPDIEKIFRDYGKQITVGNKGEDKKYQALKQGSVFGTLIFISKSERFITSPIKYKKKDLRGWVVLE